MNPTASELKTMYSNMVDDILGSSHSGQCSDEEMSNVITGGVTIFNNTVDPTKRPTVKHLTFE